MFIKQCSHCKSHVDLSRCAHINLSMLAIVLVALALTSVTEAIVCLPNACDTVRCAAVTSENCNGKIVSRGGFCGCCDSCVTELGANESCMTTLLLGVPATTSCQDGYFCERSSMTCQPIIF
ncbi:unnamed protein product [Lymnaea stagnalis]|uniref:Uncharacterized protein n=1 Tax=Lymnaea stagnalis TaxID=6523 RepID=A0AAV2I6Y7_LYMST